MNATKTDLEILGCTLGVLTFCACCVGIAIRYLMEQMS